LAFELGQQAAHARVMGVVIGHFAQARARARACILKGSRNASVEHRGEVGGETCGTVTFNQ
jgi:hypothetical protein